MVGENPRDVGHEMDELSIVYGDESLPHLYENSRISLDQLLGQSDEKYGIVEQVLVGVTNQVGLDVNLAASHEWLFAPLQFVSGLVPIKAASLQRSLVRVGTIFTRKDFVKIHGLGKKVFANVVGFLRVCLSGLAANGSQFIDLLDDTIIHPESYLLAPELAKDVYDEDFKGDNEEEVHWRWQSNILGTALVC
ncbi:hypothetical protein DITRI_Ditri20bG0003700 [Diplodiscus trichospermus]